MATPCATLSTLGFARLPLIGKDEKKRPEQAAHDAADPGRLLEGEDPATPHPEEARHWVEVYDQLLTFKDRTISSTQRNLAQVPAPEAREDVEETDMVVLEGERDRFQQRLDFWKRRHRELTAE